MEICSEECEHTQTSSNDIKKKLLDQSAPTATLTYDSYYNHRGEPRYTSKTNRNACPQKLSQNRNSKKNEK